MTIKEKLTLVLRMDPRGVGSESDQNGDVETPPEPLHHVWRSRGPGSRARRGETAFQLRGASSLPGDLRRRSVGGDCWVCGGQMGVSLPNRLENLSKTAGGDTHEAGKEQPPKPKSANTIWLTPWLPFRAPAACSTCRRNRRSDRLPS